MFNDPLGLEGNQGPGPQRGDKGAPGRKNEESMYVDLMVPPAKDPLDAPPGWKKIIDPQGSSKFIPDNSTNIKSHTKDNPDTPLDETGSVKSFKVGTREYKEQFDDNGVFKGYYCAATKKWFVDFDPMTYVKNTDADVGFGAHFKHMAYVYYQYFDGDNGGAVGGGQWAPVPHRYTVSITPEKLGDGYSGMWLVRISVSNAPPKNAEIASSYELKLLYEGKEYTNIEYHQRENPSLDPDFSEGGYFEFSLPHRPAGNEFTFEIDTGAASAGSIFGISIDGNKTYTIKWIR